MPHLPGTAALAAAGAAGCGADYVKVGLWGSSTEDEAVAVLSAVREAAGDGAAVIAAAYADAERAPAPAARGRSSPRRGGRAWRGCLLDTAVKDGRGLFEWLAPDVLAAMVADAHAAGLEIALAGALRAEDLPAVRATGRGHRRRALRRMRGRPPHRAARPAPDRRAASALRSTPRRSATRRRTRRRISRRSQLRASLVWEEYREPLLAEPGRDRAAGGCDRGRAGARRGRGATGRPGSPW